jgi:hypothetical protein
LDARIVASGFVDPQTGLANLLARLPDHPAKWVGDLLHWIWASPVKAVAAA